MRVAFVGNTNNNHFAMARYLRERGVECDVLSFRHEAPHFHPSADTYDLEFMAYCRTLSWGSPATWRSLRPETVLKDLGGYDYLVGCGVAPAACDLIDRPLDIFVPYGADIFSMTRYCMVSPHRLPSIWSAVAAQRRGIGRSRVFQMDETNAIYEGLWTRYRGSSERWRFGLPMVHTGTYQPDRMHEVESRTHWSTQFREVRQGCDIMLLYHARHVWGGSPEDPGQKGTDRLLHGLAHFKARHPDIRIGLVTLEYGSDVAKSKALIEHLDLGDVVHWFPRMYRKDVMVAVALADIVAAEFANSWISSGVIYEALAMGRPLLGYRQDELYADRYETLYPMMNARTADDIAELLTQYAAAPDEFRSMGLEGRMWYERNVVERAINTYLGYFRDARVPALA